MGGEEGRKKMCSISWDKVCRPKKERGLGVKHCGRFNLALLCKWKWRILNGGNFFWTNFLSCRYNDIKRAMLMAPSFHSRSKSSLWWRDLCSIGADAST